MSETFLISRADLAPIFGQNPRVLQQFEEMQRAVSDHGDAIGANVAATSSLADATFVTLSPNAELGNEYVLSVSEGLELLTGTGWLPEPLRTAIRAEQSVTPETASVVAGADTGAKEGSAANGGKSAIDPPHTEQENGAASDLVSAFAAE